MKDNVKRLVNRQLPVDCLPQEDLSISYVFQKLHAERCAYKCATGRVSSGQLKALTKETCMIIPHSGSQYLGLRSKCSQSKERFESLRPCQSKAASVPFSFKEEEKGQQ